MVTWPQGIICRPIERWPGEFTRVRRHAPFEASWHRTLVDLTRELSHLKATSRVLQIAVRERDLRLDGMPRAEARPEHPGVILSIEAPDLGSLSWPCDTYTDWRDNVRAIGLALDALRRVDRYGVTRHGEQYTGWKALPAGRGDAASGMTATDAAAVIYRAAGAVYDGESRPDPVHLGESLRLARRAVHPDRHGGDRGQWNLVDNAEQTLRRAGWLPPREIAS